MQTDVSFSGVGLVCEAVSSGMMQNVAEVGEEAWKEWSAAVSGDLQSTTFFDTVAGS